MDPLQNEGNPASVFMRSIEDRKGVEETVQILGEFLGNVAFWENDTGNLHLAAKSSQFVSQVKEMPLHELIAIYPHGTVEDKGERLGYVLYYREEGADPTGESQILRFGTTALRLAIEERKGRSEENHQMKGDLVRDILAKNRRLAERSLRKAAERGSGITGSLLVLVAKFNGGKNTSEPVYLLSRWFQSRFPSALQGTVMDDLVLLLPVKSKEWRNDLESALAEFLSKRKGREEFSIGVGSVVDNAVEAWKSHEEAMEAIVLGGRLDKGPVSFWQDMEIYDVLRSLPPTAKNTKFVNRYMNVIRQDKDARDTLRSLVRSGWHLKTAAADLKIHYNTLRYRQNRIWEILGMDGQDPMAKLNLTLACLMDEIKEDMGP
ncbi:transcriptional regulator, CdaR [Dethiosulfovibrio peptidovorans DSM 11002]|uniref:Transcriptional regulator, CdaR n=1 Tax=Dethiosulfovibrio peptidovorans DSM 11002 TaxID=469381 RepID=D2Z3N7_9BACT|nr:helix-turn-helix domain-containing protein [Dethiosulfovibrio peptidovorans]EFC90343.1 transcriptional regulator, CdaR [Dethiosulfovibrio peptidovorans DSM 11002]